eukprot:15441602-Alexandrium_andersonii.AAC.1
MERRDASSCWGAGIRPWRGEGPGLDSGGPSRLRQSLGCAAWPLRRTPEELLAEEERVAQPPLPESPPAPEQS